MDIFGPLKTSQSGKKYIMVVRDAFTKWVELIAIPDKQVETVAKLLQLYSPNGCVNMVCRIKLCQMEEKNSAVKLCTKCLR